MIQLTRLNDISFVINADLIERIQEAPDTILYMADGTTIVVKEPLKEVVARINIHRAEVLALAYKFGQENHAPSDFHVDNMAKLPKKEEGAN